ncbi:MAG: hypothetical protein ACSHXB_17645 [Sulfitobacter sp.]
MPEVTGYRLYNDTGDAGPSAGDGVSGGAYPDGFNTDNYSPTGTAVVDYPETGPVTGQFYFVDGGYYFVPDDPSPFPLSQPGTIQSYNGGAVCFVGGTLIRTPAGGNPPIFNGAQP